MSWPLAAFALLALALGAGFAWYERSRPSARVLALVGTLAALAVIGRVAFAPLPNVKPTTDIVLIAGFALGGAPGFAVGAVTALASNVFFGQGPWTPWQMAAWGGVGLAGAVLARLTGRRAGRLTLTAACVLAGLAYGVVLNLSTWVTFSGEHTLASYLALAGPALPFDLAHAIGNGLFCLAFGPALLGALERYRERAEITWLPAPGATAALALVAVAAALLASATEARAAAPGAALRYLERAQNADGGFGGGPGQRSTGLHSGWAALGLAAAGRSPASVRAGGPSLLDHVRRRVVVSDLGEVERTIMVVAAAGASPRDVGGRDLVAALLRRRRGDGSFAGQVTYTAFGVIALRSAGRPAGDRVVSAAGRFLARQANRDGGFSFDRRGGASGVDDTAAALQGLVAAGRRDTGTVRRGASFLVRRQRADGGFPLVPGGTSNAQSTAFVVQALLAAGREPEQVRRGGSRSPLGYLRSLVGDDGAVRYARTSRQTPVWVTAQVVIALARRPFPLPVVRRAASGASRPAARVRPAPGPARARPATRRPAARTRRAPPGPGARMRAPSAWVTAAARRAGVAVALLATPLS